MAVRTIIHGQEGTRGGDGNRLSPEALQRIEQRRGGGPGAAATGDGGDGGEAHGGPAGAPPPADPGQSGQAPPPASGQPATPPAAPAATPPAPAAQAQPPAAPTGAPPGDSAHMQAQIELERATQQLRQSNQEAQTLRQQLQELQQREQERRQAASDPRRLLMAHGHDPLQAIETILGDDQGGGQRPQQNMGRDSREGPDVLAQLRQLLDERLGPIEQSLQGDQAARQHAHAVGELRQIVSGAGDHMSAIAALDHYDSAQARLDEIAQARGYPLTPTERMAELYKYERTTRSLVEQQLQGLAKLPWAADHMLGSLDPAAVVGKVAWDSEQVVQALAQNPAMVQAIRKALDSAAGARPATDPASAQQIPGHPAPQPPAQPLGQTNPAVLDLQERGLVDLKREGRAAAARLFEDRRRGLG